jgi:hypothetical protein
LDGASSSPGAAARRHGRSLHARSNASGYDISAYFCREWRTMPHSRPGSARSYRGLAQSGWIIGRNVQIDTRWAEAKAEDIRRRAQELVALAPRQ